MTQSTVTNHNYGVAYQSHLVRDLCTQLLHGPIDSCMISVCQSPFCCLTPHNALLMKLCDTFQGLVEH